MTNSVGYYLINSYIENKNKVRILKRQTLEFLRMCLYLSLYW